MAASSRLRTLIVIATAIGITVATELPVAAADQNYYWRWSDGSKQSQRTFTQAEYGIPSNLPSLIVTAEPASPSRYVYLQFLRDGRWTTESQARSNARGIASIDVDPLCGGSWCNSTYSYRLKIGGQTARLDVTYAAR